MILSQYPKPIGFHTLKFNSTHLLHFISALALPSSSEMPRQLHHQSPVCFNQHQTGSEKIELWQKRPNHWSEPNQDFLDFVMARNQIQRLEVGNLLWLHKLVTFTAPHAWRSVATSVWRGCHKWQRKKKLVCSMTLSPSCCHGPFTDKSGCCWILLLERKLLGLCGHSTRLFLEFNELVVHQTWSWGCPVARIVEGTNTQSMLDPEIVWGLAIIYIPVTYLSVYVLSELFNKKLLGL